LAEATLRILGDPELKRRLEHEAYAYGRETAWPRVGERMLALLRAAATHATEADRAAHPRLVAGARAV
jgi:hypothetical protein